MCALSSLVLGRHDGAYKEKKHMLRTIKEESEERGVAPSTLRGWIQRGAPAIVVGGTTHVRPEDIDAFLESEEDETPDDEREPDEDEDEDEDSPDDDEAELREELAALRERLDELESDMCEEEEDDD